MIVLIIFCFIYCCCSCSPCVYGNYQYGCGAYFYPGNQKLRCCQGSWHDCRYSGNCDDPACCRCAEMYNLNITKEGIAYSKYVYPAIYVNDHYVIDKRVHSSKLRVDQFVWWPINNRLEVIKVLHHNVTINSDNCCWFNGSDTKCISGKYCCGIGCCC